jgi:hypothetical protein
MMIAVAASAVWPRLMLVLMLVLLLLLVLVPVLVLVLVLTQMLGVRSSSALLAPMMMVKW